MIKITLEFALAQEAIAFLSSIADDGTTKVTAEVAEKPKPEPKPEPKPKSTPRKKAEPKPEPEPEEVDVTEYATLQKKVLEVVKIDRDTAVSILEDMGYSTFAEVPEERWNEAYGRLDAALVELRS